MEQIQQQHNSNTEKKIYSLLGLCARAGKVCSGNFQTEEAVRRKKAFLVIVAADSGPNTSSLFQNKCAYYHVPLRTYGTKAALGKAIGKEMRSSLALTDAGFAGSISKFIDEAERGQNGTNEDQ